MISDGIVAIVFVGLLVLLVSWLVYRRWKLHRQRLRHFASRLIENSEYTSPTEPPVRVSSLTDKVIMPAVITTMVLVAALYVILSKNYDSDTQKWTFGVVGLIVGYWLPTQS